MANRYRLPALFRKLKPDVGQEAAHGFTPRASGAQSLDKGYDLSRRDGSDAMFHTCLYHRRSLKLAHRTVGSVHCVLPPAFPHHDVVLLSS
jgi:hypothetical protein